MPRFAVLAVTFMVAGLLSCGGGVVKAPETAHPAPVATDPNIPPPSATVVSNIQNRPGWSDCSATLVNGFTCAAGEGQAVAWMAQNRTEPSLSGASAEFHLGGPVGYSNNLWWNALDPNPTATHFAYDFWILTPDPSLPQALEFDVNQSFGGNRWVFGTECNLNGNGRWDVWDGSPPYGHWVPTNLGCPRLAPNTWAHIIWRFERVGDKVHYVSLTVNDTEYSVDMYQNVEQNWHTDQLTVAVQLDGDSQQRGYSIFLDKVSLTYW